MECTDKEVLITNRLLKNCEEIERYENIIVKIIERNDLRDIGILVFGFSDDTEEDGVMFGLIHALDHYTESYTIREHIEMIANSIYDMKDVAEGWVDIILYRILNTKGYPEEYRKVINVLGEKEREYNIQKLEKIALEDEEMFGSVVRGII